jgi:hypothetical protein
VATTSAVLATLGPRADQIPGRMTSYGLRTVDGSGNSLVPGRDTFAAADQVFPRLTTPDFRAAQDVPPGFGPSGPTRAVRRATGDPRHRGAMVPAWPHVVHDVMLVTRPRRAGSPGGGRA